MPAFGYGALGGAVRGLFSRGAMDAAIGSTVIGRSSSLGGQGLKYASSGLSGLAGMSNLGLSATGGAVAGGMYGAIDSNTSILGGAMMGAALGAGGLGATRLGTRGMGVYRRTGNANAAFTAMGRMSKRFIGRTMSRPYSKVASTLQKGSTASSPGANFSRGWGRGGGGGSSILSRMRQLL